MENKKINDITESYLKNWNATSKWMTELSSAFVENYGKQITTATDWYNKIIDQTTWDKKANPSDFFRKNMEQFSNSTKSMIKSIVDIYNQQLNAMTPQKEIAEIIIKAYDEQVQLFLDFNKKFLDVLLNNQTGIMGNKNDGHENFKNNIQNQFDSSRESIKTIMDFYGKMTNNFSETNSEILGKINTQIDSLSKGNLQFWTDLMNSSYAAIKEDSSKSSRANPSEENQQNAYKQNLKAQEVVKQ